MKKVLLIGGLVLGILLLIIAVFFFIRWRRQSGRMEEPDYAKEQLLAKGEKDIEERPTAKQDNERINKVT